MAVLTQGFWVGRTLRCGGCGCLALLLKGAEPVRTVARDNVIETAIFACPMCAQPVAIDRQTPLHPVTHFQKSSQTDSRRGSTTATRAESRGFAARNEPFRLSWDT